MPVKIKPGGIGQYFNEPGQLGSVREVHHSTCAHCQKGTEFPSMRKMMDYVDICRVCMRLVCLECHDKGVCTPFVKLIDEKDAEEERRKTRLKAGW